MNKTLGDYLGRGWARNEDFYELLMNNLVIDDYMEEKIFELVISNKNFDFIEEFSRNVSNLKLIDKIETKILNIINQDKSKLSSYNEDDISNIIRILCNIAEKKTNSLEKIIDAIFTLGDKYTPFWLAYKQKTSTEIMNKALNVYLSEGSAEYIYELFETDILSKKEIFEELIKAKGTDKAEYLLEYLDEYEDEVTEEEIIKIEYAMTTADDFDVMYDYFWKHPTDDNELLKLRENAIIRSKDVGLIYKFAMKIEGADVKRLRTILNSYYRHEYRDYCDRWLEMMLIDEKLKEYKKTRKLARQ